jgi:hypothetical protein
MQINVLQGMDDVQAGSIAATVRDSRLTPAEMAERV